MYLLEGQPGLLEEVRARGRETDGATLAIEELRPELGLEPAYLAAEMGLGHVKPRRGAAEVSLLGHGDERVEMADLQSHTRFSINLALN